jgi:hypothetical protein
MYLASSASSSAEYNKDSSRVSYTFRGNVPFSVPPEFQTARVSLGSLTITSGNRAAAADEAPWLGNTPCPMCMVHLTGVSQPNTLESIGEGERRQSNLLGLFPLTSTRYEHDGTGNEEEAEEEEGELVAEPAPEPAPPPPPQEAHIVIDGGNDYIQLSELANGTENVLTWDHDWSLGVSLDGVSSVSDSTYMTLFSRGDNGVFFVKGPGNWGCYVSGNGGGYKQGMNTWTPLQAHSKLLFTYSHATSQMKYYLGSTGSTGFSLKGTLALNSTVLANSSNSSATFEVGMGVGASHFEGGVNNLVISDIVLQGANIADYFATGLDFTEHATYSDYTTYCRLGEDVYPAVTDSKGNATGVLANGTPIDFVVDVAAETVADEEVAVEAPPLSLQLPQLPVAAAAANTTRVTGSSYRRAGGAIDDGALVSGTVLNTCFSLDVELPSGWLWKDVLNGYSENTSGKPTVYFELDVQLLKNEVETGMSCN